MLFSGWDVRLSLAGLVGVRAKLSWVARNKVYVNWVSVNFFLVSSKFPFWLRSILKKALFAFRKIEVLFFKAKLVVFKFKILVLCWRYSNSCFTFEYTYHVSVWKNKCFFLRHSLHLSVLGLLLPWQKFLQMSKNTKTGRIQAD